MITFSKFNLFILMLFVSACHPGVRNEEQRTGNLPSDQYKNTYAGRWDSLAWKSFHETALQASLLPVRPGIPGKTPFWNGYAKRFIYVPSFDFKTIAGSANYKFTAISDVTTKSYTFTAKEPWALLTPVWEELPTGLVYLKVEGLDKDGNKTGIAGAKMFYKAAVFNGPYRPAFTDYRSAVIKNFRSLLKQEYYSRWETDTVPSPEYMRYCYPSKMMASIIQGMCLYSGLSEKDSARALRIAGHAAKYLLGISLPPGTPLAYFPPTYLDLPNSTAVARRRKDQIMMFYPAVVGDAYLDLFKLTGDKDYLDASVKIGQTYVNTLLPEGTWPMMVWIDSGQPVEENRIVPTDIIGFLNRLAGLSGQSRFDKAAGKAFQWIMRNPMATFNWEAQFEDMGYSKDYSNLERGKALSFAGILLSRSEKHPEYVKMAEELIRFAEDQFIVWEQPLPREMFRKDERPIPGIMFQTAKYFTPCVLEQYGYYTPIDASAASAIFAFKKAWEVTGKDLYLAKAIALANNLTVAQELDGGIFPTYMMDLTGHERYDESSTGNYRNGVWTGWINCATISSAALFELDKTLKGEY